jgi:chromosome segregation ATPase
MDAIEASSYWTGAYLEWLDEAEQRRLEKFREALREMAARTDVDCARLAEALWQAERLLEDEREALDGVAAELHTLESKVRALESAARALS